MGLILSRQNRIERVFDTVKIKKRQNSLAPSFIISYNLLFIRAKTVMTHAPFLSYQDAKEETERYLRFLKTQNYNSDYSISSDFLPFLLMNAVALYQNLFWVLKQVFLRPMQLSLYFCVLYGLWHLGKFYLPQAIGYRLLFLIPLCCFGLLFVKASLISAEKLETKLFFFLFEKTRIMGQFFCLLMYGATASISFGVLFYFITPKFYPLLSYIPFISIPPSFSATSFCLTIATLGSLFACYFRAKKHALSQYFTISGQIKQPAS